jgi:hypothetical protein
VASSISPEAVQHQVRHRLAALRVLSFAELAVLPEWCSEDVPFGQRVADVTTYRHTGPDGALQIVVQCMPEGRDTGFVWAGVFAEGFWIWPDGRTEPLPDRFRFAYM